MKEKNTYRDKLLIGRLMMVCVFFILFSFFYVSSAFSQDLEQFQRDSLLVSEFNQEGRRALRFGDFEKAVVSYSKAINLIDQIYREETLQAFLPLVNLGVAHKNQGEYDKSIDIYVEAESLIKSLYGDKYPRIGFVYSNLGTVYKLKGDFVKNLEYQQAALRAFQLEPKKYQNQVINGKYLVCEALYLLGEYDTAINDAIENLNEASDNVKTFYYSLLARIYDKIGESDSTKEYYQKTFKTLVKIAGENSYDLGLEYTDYTEFLLSIGEYDEAFKYAQLSEDIVKKYFTEKSQQYSDVMLNYADYYFNRSSSASVIADFYSKRKEDLDEALKYYQKALIAGSEGFNSLLVSDNPELGQEVSEVQVLKALKKKANCLETIADLNVSSSNRQDAISNYNLALNTIERATELIHQIRTGYVSEDSQFFLAENQESTFIDAVGLSYKLFQQTNDFSYAERGFEFAEKSKSASFLAAVKDTKAKQFGGIPDRLINRENYLKMNISNYKEMLFEEKQNSDPDSARIELFNSKIFQLGEQYGQLVQVLEDSFPNYYSFKYQNDVVGVAEVQKRIDEKTALVEYLIEEPTTSLPEGQVFKFVITSDELRFTRELIDSSFVENIESVYQFLTSSAYLFTGLEEFKGYAVSAFQLYDVLLDNESMFLDGKDLVIVPDDKLAYIPFDALLSEFPDTTKMNFRVLPYLVRDYSISYTYSATLLYDYFENDKTAKNDLLAFAPSYEGDSRDYTANAEYRAGLLPLPAVKKEVEFIHKYVNGDVFEDSLAQEGRFKEMASDYDILHLAMHTIVNDTLPMYSKLAFSKPYLEEKDDGWLNTNEIYTMDLKARMAVLSACNTGSGKLQKGEGVMSLARGFLYAGCPSIVMTLWEVEDESGAHIMKDFYKFLSKGKSKNESLRSAKLVHIENADPLKAHPHYWLGYVVVGNADPLFGSKDFYFILVIFWVIVLLFIDQVYRKRKARD